MERYLINGALDALEPQIFKAGLSLPLHAQNLCLVLNNDNTPRGFALRDHGDVYKKDRFVETYSWFYRYHVMIKLLNVITKYSEDELPPIPGSPTQFGYTEPLTERSTYQYIEKPVLSRIELLSASKFIGARRLVDEHTITFSEYTQLLEIMDEKYLAMLGQYFDLEKAGIALTKLHIPAAEVGSAGEQELMKLNELLWQYPKSFD
jgi:hypothetical protein